MLDDLQTQMDYLVEATDEEMAPLERHVLSHWPQLMQDPMYVYKDTHRLEYLMLIWHYVLIPWEVRTNIFGKQRQVVSYEDLLRYTCCAFGYNPAEGETIPVMEEILMARWSKLYTPEQRETFDAASLVAFRQSTNAYLKLLKDMINPILEKIPGLKDAAIMAALPFGQKVLPQALRVLKHPAALLALLGLGGYQLYKKYQSFDRTYVIMSVLAYVTMRHKIDERRAECA